MLASKHKPDTLNFKDYSLPNNNNQITPNTPTLINLLQDLTPTNFGYNFDIPDKDDVLRQFSKHYKSIEDSHQKTVQNSELNYALNNNTPFTLDLLSNDTVEPDTNFNDFNNLGRPLPSESSFSSDVQSCSNESNSSNSHSYNVHIVSAKKRERNRLAAEKCRLKKQGKITELENEKRKRMHENSILIEKIKKRKETIKNLKLFYKKLQIGEFKPQPCYN